MKKILCFIFLIYGWNAHAQKHWAINSGGTDNEEAYASAIDSQGNIYTTGYYMGTADFNPDSGVVHLTASSSDIFIQKLDSNGHFLWAKSLGGLGWDAGMHLVLGENGSIYVTGLYEKIVDFDPNAGIRLDTAKGNSDFFVLKLSKNGDYIWHSTLGGKGKDGAYAVGIDKQYAIYLTGFFEDTFDFNPGMDSLKLKSKGMHDVFLLKLDSMGNFIWAKSIGGPGDDEVYSLFVETSGHLLISGTFKFNADFDPSDSSFILSSNRGRGFIEKINSNGEFIWVKQFGNPSFTSCLFVKSDRDGNVYSTGNFSSMGDFNPDTTTNYITSSGLNDAFIVKLDSMGKFIWVKRFGGVGNDQGMCLDIDSDGGVYLSGSYEGKIDLDPGIGHSSKSNRGGRDIFLSTSISREIISGLKQLVEQTMIIAIPFKWT
ncbi:MAG: hypothetical protein IPK03_01670 [Bacteroidetes bacterium]|nr:hypothetical protein [Bacteroidota bacterium]